MKINEIDELKLPDLTNNLINESVREFAFTKIRDMHLNDLEYLVRQHMWTAALIRICIQKINDNWDDIQIGYPKSDLAEWFENVSKELILLPKRTWDIDKLSYNKFSEILNTVRVRKIKLDGDIINNFLAYKPQILEWNDKTFDFFERYISSHHGDVLEAIKLIQDYVICLINGDEVRYRRNRESIIITNLESFENIVLAELSKDKNWLMHWLKNEQRLDYY